MAVTINDLPKQLPLATYKVCNYVTAVYSENRLQHYATNHKSYKSAGEKLCLVIYILLLNLVSSDEYF